MRLSALGATDFESLTVMIIEVNGSGKLVQVMRCG
jgi:hypothetical protein